MSTLELDRGRPTEAKLRVIDCDIHPAMNAWTEVHPYLAKRWIEHLTVYGSHLRHAFSEALTHPRMSPDAARVDAYPDEGGPPGSSLALMRSQHLDPNGVAYGMLIPLRWNPGSQRNLDFGVALTQAMNTWQVERWVKNEPRLRASILIAQEDTVSSVKEIEARAGDPNFVQVLLLSRNVEPLGQRRYWPIYEAAQEIGLPVGVHAFGFGGNPITASGWPSYYIEEMVGHSQCQQTALASIVLEGVFERHPGLKMVMIEAGFGWAPSLGWRLDKNFDRLRSEVPHLKRRPSEYIRDHIWWTTQPMEDPERRDHLFDVIDWVGWDKLLFATDYPHWDYDEPSRVLPAGVSDDNREAFYLGNAKKLYGIA